jgi:hypothetical protein
MLLALQQRLIHRHELYGPSGVGNPCDLVEHLREQQGKFHLRGYRVLQHLLRQVLHLLNL